MRSALFATFVLLVAAAPSLRTEDQISESPAVREVLLRPLSNLNSSPLFVDMAFQSALLAADVPGGEIITDGCGGEPQKVVRLQGATLRDALDTITRSDPDYRWRVVGGVVNLLPAGEVPRLLRVQIGVFDSRDAADIVSAGTFLFDLPEIRRAAGELGLTHNVSGTGLGAMAPGPPVPKKPLRVHCERVTVMDALNAIVHTNGHGVWLYRERHYNGNRLFDINFAQ